MFGWKASACAKEGSSANSKDHPKRSNYSNSVFPPDLRFCSQSYNSESEYLASCIVMFCSPARPLRESSDTTKPNLNPRSHRKLSLASLSIALCTWSEAEVKPPGRTSYSTIIYPPKILETRSQQIQDLDLNRRTFSFLYNDRITQTLSRNSSTANS